MTVARRATTVDAADTTLSRDVLEWQYNPWRERPGVSMLAAVIAFGMCVLVLRLELSTILAVALCLVAVSAVSPLLTPARCRVDSGGVGRRGPLGWTRRAWADIRRAVAYPAGLFVSPFARPHWLDPYRSLFLPFPASHRVSLREETQRRLQEHGF